MSNERWSEWIEHDGKSVPDLDGKDFQYRLRLGSEMFARCPFACYKDEFIHAGLDKDIIAYRYRLDDSTMTEEEEEIPA